MAAFLTPAQSGSAWLNLAKRFLAEEQGSAKIARKLAMAPPKLKNADPITQKAFEEVIRRKAEEGRRIRKPSAYVDEEAQWINSRPSGYWPEQSMGHSIPLKERHPRKSAAQDEDELQKEMVKLMEPDIPFNDTRYNDIRFLGPDSSFWQNLYKRELPATHPEYRKPIFTSADPSDTDVLVEIILNGGRRKKK